MQREVRSGGTHWGSLRTLERLAGLRTPGDSPFGAGRSGWGEDCLSLPTDAVNPVICCCVGLQ